MGIGHEPHEYLEILESTLGAIWAMLYAEGMSERLDGVGLLDVLCDIVLFGARGSRPRRQCIPFMPNFDVFEVNIVASTKMKGDSRKMKDDEEEQDGKAQPCKDSAQGVGSKKVKRKRYFSTIDEKSLPRNALSNAACLAMQALRVAVAKDHALAEVAFRKKIPRPPCYHFPPRMILTPASVVVPQSCCACASSSNLSIQSSCQRDDASLDEGKVLQSAQRRRSIEGKAASKVEEDQSATAEGNKEEKEEGKGAEENEGNEELEKNSFELPWAQNPSLTCLQSRS